MLKRSNDPPQPEQSALNEYRPKKARAEQHMNEKIAIAEQTLEIVDAVMRELDGKLEAFEAVLKGAGDFEAAVVEPGREVHLPCTLYLCAAICNQSYVVFLTISYNFTFLVAI